MEPSAGGRRPAWQAALGAGASLMALAGPAGASNAPASATLTGRLVTAAPATSASAGRLIHPLRVRDPAQYTAAKAAADQRFSLAL